MLINMLITIDGGTTNTRLTLIENGKITDRIKKKVGARDSLDGSPLKNAVRDGISELLGRNDLTESRVDAVVLSGMIGSASGLAEIPHITAPAGRKELSRALVQLNIPEICSVPLTFIPGVKTFSCLGKDRTVSELSALAAGCDIMRGEETEIVGILSAYGENTRGAAVILPGSHLKIVRTDVEGRIVDFSTSISGELMRAAAENTILSQSLQGVFPKKADEDWLRAGFDAAGKLGLNSALFKIRILSNFASVSPEKLYAYLMGAVFREDVLSAASAGKVITGGSDPFRHALSTLLRDLCEVKELDDDLAENCSAIGAEAILTGAD